MNRMPVTFNRLTSTDGSTSRRFGLTGRPAQTGNDLLEAANASPAGEAVHAGDHGTGGGGASIVREVARNLATVA
jgi:hypothetical protein